jgi:plastocyanin
MIGVAYAVLVGLLLAGCGGGGSNSTSTSTKGPTIIDGFQVLKVIAVHETEYALAPSAIKIDRFGYYGIKAVNDGKVTHALTVTGHGIDKSTGEIAPGQSAQFAVYFKRAGKYRIFCPVDGHEAKGMKGTVKVH